MKVVIFCGGQGLRMREASDVVPKPMVPIGNRPVLWHVMKYYAHFGFTDFVLCLGYKAEAIKHFFLTYNEAMANDFVLSEGGAKVHLLKTDIHNWNITFVDTGLHACIGERLRAVRHLLRDDEMFLANYGDTLTDADLPAMIAGTRATGATASFLAVRPNYSFHVVSMDDARDRRRHPRRDAVGHLDQRRLLRLRSELLDDIRPGEELVEEPFHRLLARDGCWPSATKASGRRWTRSRTSSAGGAARERSSAVAAVGAGQEADRDLAAAGWLMLPLLRAGPTTGRSGCSRSAPTPTTSRSAAEARSSGWSSRVAGRRSAGSC